VNREEFLKTAADVIFENFHPDDPNGGMTASKAGVLVRRACSNDFSRFGFFKFKDVLSELAASGSITVGPNSNNVLAIWLGARARSSTPSNSAKGTIAVRSLVAGSSRFQGFLQKPVWLAFVTEVPVGDRYVNRETGEVRMACEEAPGPTTEWAKVNPLSDSKQRELARTFLASENLADDPTVASPLDNRYWFNEFPAALRERSTMLVSRWNRYRSEHVIEYVCEWCRTNSVPQEVIFEKKSSASQRVVCQEPAETTDLRRTLLDAIAQMSLDEILGIPIPAKYLIWSLRPDLEKRFSGARPRY
jgi:hypothetical protein